MLHPHQGVVDACAQSAAAYDPANALRVIEWYDGAAEAVTAFAEMLTAQGDQTAEEFYMHPAAAGLMTAIGARFAAYVDVIHEARNGFEIAHKPDLDRIRDPQPNQAKWDISANQD